MPRRWLPSLTRRFLASSRASVATEFAILSPVIVGLTLGMLQIGVVYFANSQLQMAAEASARIVRVGAANLMSTSQFHTAFCANIPSTLDCSGVIVNVWNAGSTAAAACANLGITSPSIAYDSNGKVTNVSTFTAGSASSVMVLQALYPLPVIQVPYLNLGDSAGNMTLVSTIVFMNEP